MDKITNFIKPLAGIILLGIIAYFFPEVTIYFVISALLFMLGRPLAERIKKLHIKKYYINSSIASIITLVAMFSIIGLFLLIIIPLISREASDFSKIDTHAILLYFNEPITKVYHFLIQTNIIPADKDLFQIIEAELNKLISWTNFGNVFNALVSTTSSIFVGIFSVIFITFFLLREPQIIHNIFMAIAPEKYVIQMNTVLSDTRTMLTRYIFGLLIELICMMILISIGLTIFGIKNAIVIGFIGGFMNIIPYLGPLMGAIIGTVLGIVTVLGGGEYSQLIPDAIAIIGVFIVSNSIDNLILQPTIYSKSVVAHPIEIFLVILMAGKIGGIIGMVVAIPVYTIIRIIAKQFLSQFKFIELLTRNMKF